MAFDVEGARRAGYSEREIAEYLGRERKFDTDAAFRAGYSPADILQHLGAAAPKAAPTSIRDVALSVGQGALGGIQALTDVFGAGNVVSQALERGQRAATEAMTPERQAELLRAQQRAKAAEGQGTMAEISAALQGVKEAPLQSAAQAVGSFLPFVATSVAGAAAKLLPATMRAINMAIGSAQGVGAVKGSIYDSVKERLVAEGMSPETAEQQAQAAQAYVGKNTEQLLLGGGLGALAGRFGAENLLSRAGAQGAAPGLLRRAGTAAVGEAIPEGAQGAQERLAANLALQREGFDVSTLGGVAGQATTEALLGALGGGAVAAVRGPEIQPPPAPPAPPQPPAPPAPPEIDLSRPAQELILQREALRAEEQTPAVKDAIKQLDEQIKALNVADVEAARARKAQEQADAEKAARSAFTQPGQQMEMREFLPPGGAQLATEMETEPTLREQRAEYRQGRRDLREEGQMRLPFRYTAEGEPTSITPPPPPRIYMTDIEAVGVPFKTARDWFNRNVVNRTRDEVAALVEQDPSLVQGRGARAKILRTLLGPEVPAFKEPPRAKPTPTSAQPQPGGDQRGVGVPSALPDAGTAAGAAPAAPEGPIAAGLDGVEPSAPAGVAGEGQQALELTPDETPTTAPTPGAPAAAAPVEGPTGAGVEAAAPAAAPAAQEPPAAPPAAPVEDTRTAAEVQAEMDSLRNQQQGLLTAKGKIPAPKSKARTAYDALETQIQTLRPIYDQKAEAERQRDAADMQRRMEEQQKKTAAPVRPTPAAAAPAPAQPTPPISEEMREPIGTSTFGMEEGQVEIRRGPQAELFPSSKAETRKRAEAADERERAAAEEAPAEAPAVDERQAELDLQPREEAAAPPAPAEPEFPQWATEFAKKYPGGKVVYTEGDLALIRTVNTFGYTNYVVAHSDGRAERVDVRTGRSPLLSDEDRARFVEARARAIDADVAGYAAKFDGPFTGATSNVVGTENVPQKYVDYLADLTKSLGIGDVRFFIHNSDDLIADSDRYGIHGPYLAGLNTTNESPQTNGSVVSFGRDRNDFIIYMKPGMSEAQSLEVLAHELGHAIQQIAYDNAPAGVQFAIRKEYEAWLKENKKPGMTAIELAHNLRTREQAKEFEAYVTGLGKGEIRAEDLENVDSYWRSFSEWFADNTARWATTADKPLTITEKFFSQVAQKLRDLLRIITGRQYLPAKTVKDFLESMGPGASKMWFEDRTRKARVPERQFAVSPTVEQIVDSMGPLSAQQKGALSSMLGAFNTTDEIDAVTKFRTQAVDAAAAVEKRLSERFNGAVRDALGYLNPMGLYRQAQDYAKMLLEFYQTGTLVKDANTGLWRADSTQSVAPPTKVYDLIQKWSEKNGYDFERGKQIASRVLEGNRLYEMRESNRTQGTEFLLHLKDPEINTLKAAYDADPDLQAMGAAMDESRIALVNHMESVGRLSPDQAKAWREVSGYVPFDRIEDFSERFAKVKKVSGKGLAQVGKLPELVGSINRPVGDVFENYLDTLGWMVGQVLKTDATVTTLRALENMGRAKFLGNTTQFKSNTVGAYVDGELKYWELPSRYDVLAFKDLNPPKAGWLKALSSFSNLLRTTVTALPPFALKQVTDDVQRAIMTSGVQNVGGLVYSTLTNFPKLVVAELRGIQHPMVREFGALGLTGEYDFQQGKPAQSLLKDLGLKKRGRFENLMHKLDGITRASDLAVRKAIYDHTLRETNDALLAQTRAREFINFRRRGANDFVGVMVSTIPFFNAYAQGMDVLYRAATGQTAGSSVERAQALKMFWSRAAMLTAMATLYAMGKSDDEDYQEMDLRTRDSNWILPNGYKLPVPGEFAAIFKVIPERVVEYYRRSGTPEEQTAWEATRTALTYMAEQYVGRMVPIPQAAKPLLEAWTNFSFLTGRPLEGIFQKQVEPSRRRGADTSELAIAIADFSRDVVGVQVSPILIDNTLRGYLGSTAAMVTMVTDGMLNPDRTDRPLHKWALLSNYLYDPVGTRRIGEFYEMREKVGLVKQTLAELARTDLAAAEAYAEKNGDILSLTNTVNDTIQQLERTRAYRKFLNSAEGAKEMSVEERTKELEEIRKYEVGLADWVREAKTEINRAAGKTRI